MKTYFYTLLQDHRRSLYCHFIEIIIILDVQFKSNGYASKLVYTLYIPSLVDLCKFHKDWISSLDILAV